VPEAVRALRAHAPDPATGSKTDSSAPSRQRGPASGPVDHSAVVARACGVHHGYRTVHGTLQKVLDGLDVDLRRGDRMALVGGNGSGKTTLLKLLAGILVPRSGEVEVAGISTRKKSAGRLADHVAYLWQQPQQMFLTESIRADVALFPRE